VFFSGAGPLVRGRPPGRLAALNSNGGGSRGTRADQGVRPTTPAVCILACSLALCLTTCSHRAPPDLGRLAILRFENLTGDPSLDWIGRALAEVISFELGEAKGTPIISTARLHNLDTVLARKPAAVPGISSERTQAILAGANRMGYGEYEMRNGKLVAHLSIEDAATSKTVRLLSSAAPDVLATAGALARQINSAAPGFGTHSEAALRSFVTALDAADGAIDPLLRQAIAADPSFASSYLLLAQWQLGRQDRAGAQATLEQAMARASSMSAADRARIEYQLAVAKGDAAARRKALVTLAASSPNDPAVWRALAEDEVKSHRYREAIQAYQKAVAADPTDIVLLNALGYTAAYAGDLPTAIDALGRYAKLRPNEANPLDSLGDVHFHLGRFKEAEENYLKAYEKDAAFLAGGTLFKAAAARLATADVAGADAIVKRYFDTREAAKDQVLAYRRAQWLWTSGRRQPGAEELAKFAKESETGPLREFAARAYAQLAIWSLATGNRTAADRYADRAVALAGPASGAMAIMAKFLAQPPASASEWAARAERAFPHPAQTGFKNFALVYALLLAKEYAAAAPLLAAMYQTSSLAEDSGLPVLLAWTYLEAEKTADAAPLLTGWPIPSPDGFTPFTVFQFPRLLYLRGWLAEKQGNRDGARQWYRAFLQVSGPQPLVWGEEKRAAEMAK
jgi:tetratricopeptide (TPR) repeat protein